jgi:hypothetical protein
VNGRRGTRLGLALLVVAVLVAAVVVAALSRRSGRAPAAAPATSTAPAPSASAGAPSSSGGTPGTTGGAGGTQAAASAPACPQRPHPVRVTGTRRDALHVAEPPSDTTYDLRGLRSVAFPDQTLYPLSFGDVRHGRPTGPAAQGLCIIGGTVVGQQPRSLTWRQVKRSYDGDGLRVQAGGRYVVEGLRVDNVEDGISPFGDGFVGRGLYFTYIRDDCIENDAISGGVVADSLLDGCSMGLSERPSKGFRPTPPPAGETFTLDGVLLRLEPMPRDDAPDGLGNGQLFKWSRWANRLVLRNSVFLVERVSMNGRRSMRFPAGTTAENVTLVWTGPGSYPAPVPPGVRVTKDRSVWDAARSAWLTRHGYPVR